MCALGVSILPANVAAASSGTYTFPDTCRINWWNNFDSSLGAAQGTSTEVSGCARLRLGVAFQGAGGYTEAYTSWVFSSSIAISRGAYQGYWTRHFGDNDAGGSFYSIQPAL